jgi:hypothetical protein
MRRVDIPEAKKITSIKLTLMPRGQEAGEYTVFRFERGDETGVVHDVLIFDKAGDLAFFCDCGHAIPDSNPLVCGGISLVTAALKPVIRAPRTALRDVRNYVRGGGKITKLVESLQQRLGESETETSASPTPAGRTMFVIQIYKQHILDCDTSPLQGMIDAALLDKDAARGLIGRLNFSVEGYNDDPRELFEIPEVRKYFAKLNQESSGFFYFLMPDARAVWLAISFAQFITSRDDKRVVFGSDSRDLHAIILNGRAALARRFKELGIQDDPIVKAQDKTINNWFVALTSTSPHVGK